MHIGDGAIVGANSVVAKDVPAYCIAVGNPCRVVRKRFGRRDGSFLLDLKWWDWDAEKIFQNMELLCNGDIGRLKLLAEA